MDAPRLRSNRNWRSGLIAGLGLGVLLTAGGAGTLMLVRRPAATPPAAETTAGQAVTIASVQRASVSRTVEATGTVAARDLLPILPEATGLQVQQILVSEGQTVQRGQELAILNGSVLRSQLNQAQAQLASSQAVVGQREATLRQQQATLAEAESNLRRYQQLQSSGAISQQELEQRSTAVATAQAAVATAQATITSAEADVQAATAQLQRLQTQLDQTVVRAPEDGTIAESITKVGDVTSATGKLFTIIRNGSLELQLKLPETQLPQVKVGAPVRVTSDSDKRIQLQGSVREIAPLVDPQSRQATVKVDLPSSPFLRSGIFLRGAITTQTALATTVPAKAVLPQTNGGSIVYILQPDNTVRAQTVETGVTQGNDPNNTIVEIIRGVNVGDRVVVSGAGYLKDGDRVSVAQ